MSGGYRIVRVLRVRVDHEIYPTALAAADAALALGEAEPGKSFTVLHESVTLDDEDGTS